MRPVVLAAAALVAALPSAAPLRAEPAASAPALRGKFTEATESARMCRAGAPNRLVTLSTSACCTPPLLATTISTPSRSWNPRPWSVNQRFGASLRQAMTIVSQRSFLMRLG